MGHDNPAKNQGQRKRRTDRDRDSCINNVKLNLNLANDFYGRRQIDDSTYTRRSRNKFQRGSLENVSSNPWGSDATHLDFQSSLRRSRSLAIAREDVFTNLDAINCAAKKTNKSRRPQLIPRAKLIDKNSQRLPSSENLNLIKRKFSSQDYSHGARSPGVNRQNLPEENPTLPRFIIGGEHHEHDSLDSNYYNKSSIDATYTVSYEDLPGLSLPNYYPDYSKYDTDNTDNVSAPDNLSSGGASCELIKKYSSCDDISTEKWPVNEPDESVPYDENIVLSTNRPLYDLVNKPKTIRGATGYNHTAYHNREKLTPSSSPEDFDYLDDDKISLDYFESDRNFDEIKLNNENITKVVEESPIPPHEPIYESSIKTLIEIDPSKSTEIIKENQPQDDCTIIQIDDSNFSEDETKSKSANKHSHNYLKEFLESQKGSRLPLQNFLTKKFSNLSRKNSKELLGTNLTLNQFHSLPDITASKSLNKCEKIDRKLRKCEKSHENRFIVNIGKHFDIAAKSKIPVDFEVKIAKVPRKNRNKSKTNRKPEEKQFLEAVKNLKDTLNNNLLDENQNEICNNHNNTKPEIIGIRAKSQASKNFFDNKEEQEITMDLQDECVKEYKQKLYTMRNYWDKIAENDEDNDTKCKIVDVKTKVDDVKKKFEPEIEKSNHNKVQSVKQVFEPRLNEKCEKLSPFVKETCTYFEKSNQFESLNPNIVEIVPKGGQSDEKPHKAVKKSMSITYPEFDHVRYRVMKSDLFQKKIFAKCEKASQFDGLLQYLQDYSFQELLIDNNIVIIEPIRTKIPHETSKCLKHVKNFPVNKNSSDKIDKSSDDASGLKRHFFYHPIRVNKEVNDDELPNPDTVKQVRQFFEGGLTRSRSNQEFQNGIKTNPKTIDPDKDHCSATDTNSNPSNISDFGSQENIYENMSEKINHQDDCEFVSEDILEKIRECGSTVTYYGGKVVKKQCSQPGLTKIIMEEIKNNEQRNCNCSSTDQNSDETYQGVKFKLVKSNSCSSRLELIGTSDLKESARKYLKKHQKTRNNHLKNVKELDEKPQLGDKDAINENIRKNIIGAEFNREPRIIGEEKKLTQWGDTLKEKTYNGINYTDKKIYDYHINVKEKTKKMDEMEFEPYEVA